LGVCVASGARGGIRAGDFAPVDAGRSCVAARGRPRSCGALAGLAHAPATDGARAGVERGRGLVRHPDGVGAGAGHPPCRPRKGSWLWRVRWRGWLVIVALFIAAARRGYRSTRRGGTADWSAGQRASLSPATRAVLARLHGPITITSYTRPNVPRR